MKRIARWTAGLFFLVFLSVGFRYPYSGIENPVNMYVNDTLLLVADKVAGIQVYSVRDKQNPRHLAAIPLQGVGGMAMKNSVIYANSGYSILALTLRPDHSFDTVKVIYKSPYVDHPVMVDDVVAPFPFFSCNRVMPMAAGDAGHFNGGGSYATFAVIDTFLYYIDDWNLVTMSISSPTEPLEIARANIGWSIETLYPTEKYLFIGGTRGMYVMDRRDPARPFMIGCLQHFKACDPVVVHDSVAYVTLRSGNNCGDARDVLLTVSIADPAQPRLLSEYSVPTPYGLAVRDTLLYVAKGENGYGLFNVRNPWNVDHQRTWASFSVKDFIWAGCVMYVMGFDHVTIVDVKDPMNPAVVSTIQ
jgi:hypothetical protein